MKIRNLEVRNFRSLRDASIQLTDCTTLIGRNNTGKSNIMHALRVLLEGGKGDVKGTDYWDKDVPIQLRATLEGVTRYLPLSAEKHRPKIAAYVSEDRLTISKSYGPGVEEPGKMFLIKPQSGEAELPTGIDAALRQILPEPIMVESLADPTEEAGMKSTMAVGKIFRRVMDAIGTRATPQLDRAFRDANSLLNVTAEGDARVREIQEIEGRITRYIQENFPDCRALVRVSLPTLEAILGGITIDLDDGKVTPFQSKGQGLQRALYLSLFRALADSVRAGGAAAVSRPFILLVEEAELFLHPTAQGQMRAALEGIGSAQQVVFSTHSPVMVSPSSLRDVILVKKDPGSKETVIPAQPGIPEDDQRVLLGITNIARGSWLFFADRVMLVEGPSDACLAQAFARRLAIPQFHQERHAFVEMGGKAGLPRFQENLLSVGQDVWILVDLDFLWDGAGSVLRDDSELSQLCDRLERLTGEADPEQQNPTTDGERRRKKRAKFECLKTDGDLLRLRDSVIAKLAERRIFVLREGEIEDYAGMSDSSKGKYLDVASQIAQGTREIRFQDELRVILGSFMG